MWEYGHLGVLFFPQQPNFGMNQSAVPLPHTLFITGEMDALSNGGKKLDGFIKRLKGVATSVSHIVVPGARHKVECDQESTMILEEIKTFMDQL